jgi:hypothetical protein
MFWSFGQRYGSVWEKKLQVAGLSSCSQVRVARCDADNWQSGRWMVDGWSWEQVSLSAGVMCTVGRRCEEGPGWEWEVAHRRPSLARYDDVRCALIRSLRFRYPRAGVTGNLTLFTTHRLLHLHKSNTLADTTTSLSMVISQSSHSNSNKHQKPRSSRSTAVIWGKNLINSSTYN